VVAHSREARTGYKGVVVPTATHVSQKCYLAHRPKLETDCSTQP
jgi:hypothetical protein